MLTYVLLSLRPLLEKKKRQVHNTTQHMQCRRSNTPMYIGIDLGSILVSAAFMCVSCCELGLTRIIDRVYYTLELIIKHGKNHHAKRANQLPVHYKQTDKNENSAEIPCVDHQVGLHRCAHTNKSSWGSVRKHRHLQ